MATTYNHMFTVAFSVDNSIHPKGEDVTAEQLKKALEHRIVNLNFRGNTEWLEAIGCPEDTFENEVPELPILPCVIRWHEWDVRAVVDTWKTKIELTNSEIAYILRSMEETHNPSEGTTWDTIEFWIDNVLNKRGMN